MRESTTSYYWGFPKMLPKKEMEYVSKSILAKPQYFDADFILGCYKKTCRSVIQDPFNEGVVERLRQALLSGEPYSVIRVGDGEANLLSYSYYLATPRINRRIAERIISMQEDNFQPTESWLLVIQQLMLGSISSADIVGVIGFWRPKDGGSPESTVEALAGDLRGVLGHWRAIDFMLNEASKNVFREKVVASAHLYFSIVNNLDELIDATSDVYIVTDVIKRKVVEKLREKYSHANFHVIYVGVSEKEASTSPEFFVDFLSKLPAVMSSSLSLVAAGPWAEIYCSWIKLRGGVAVDIGSGFDLLRGKKSRPVHAKVDVESFRNFNLVAD